MNPTPSAPGETFSSNAVRLSMLEWWVVLVVLVLAGCLAAPFWERMEGFGFSSDYRIPYDLSEDYWLFGRYCEVMDRSDKTPVLGDSFIWGQYVEKEESLTHFLNRLAGSERYANAGLDGGHPLALAGLIRHHCTGVRNRDVVLHLNLLWMSSPQADLRSGGGLGINHPRLLPQFRPRIPSYLESVSDRVGVVVARHVAPLEMVRHMQMAYFQRADLARWTLEHPYENPLARITFTLPEPEAGHKADAQPWFVGGRGDQALSWVSLDESLQWKGFQDLVDVLQARGNRLFIVMGPLNEHMLSPAGAGAYRRILAEARDWLSGRGIPSFSPSTLPSELYADLSHPLGQGYALLAEGMWEELPNR